MDREPTAKNPDTEGAGPTADERALGMILDNGEPFATKRAATARLKELGIADAWEVVDYGAGFAIIRKLGVVQTGAEQPPALLPQQPVAEPYKWVRFHSKSNPMDPDEVILAVNGEVLLIRRNERIPLPWRFCECADHCRYRHFVQEPGQDRKVDREIHKYPYDILGDGTREDFTHWKRAGTKATRENAERLGIAMEA